MYGQWSRVDLNFLVALFHSYTYDAMPTKSNE